MSDEQQIYDGLSYLGRTVRQGKVYAAFAEPGGEPLGVFANIEKARRAVFDHARERRGAA